MSRVWQAASTVDAILSPGLLEKAAAAGLRSIFVGFETINAANLAEQRKRQNVGQDYAAVARRVHDAGVMVNASFVFGMDGDGPDVFDRTVEWAVGVGLETATFHIMTPYPGTALFRRMEAAGRIVHRDWDRYDTRHAAAAGVGAVPVPAGQRSRDSGPGTAGPERDRTGAPATAGPGRVASRVLVNEPHRKETPK